MKRNLPKLTWVSFFFLSHKHCQCHATDWMYMYNVKSGSVKREQFLNRMTERSENKVCRLVQQNSTPCCVTSYIVSGSTIFCTLFLYWGIWLWYFQTVERFCLALLPKVQKIRRHGRNQWFFLLRICAPHCDLDFEDRNPNLFA